MSDTAKFYAVTLHKSFVGKAWHGPSLMEALDGVDSSAASARPLANAHSIWELVNHIQAWNRIIVEWLRDRPADVALGSREDFPAVSDASESAWRRTLEELMATEKELERAVAALTDEHLRKTVPGRKYDFHTVCAGLPHHFTYHAGQISILKKSAIPH